MLERNDVTGRCLYKGVRQRGGGGSVLYGLYLLYLCCIVL